MTKYAGHFAPLTTDHQAFVDEYVAEFPDAHYTWLVCDHTGEPFAMMSTTTDDNTFDGYMNDDSIVLAIRKVA